MNDYQWEGLKKLVKDGKTDQVPVGFIIDSPWIPGWNNISMIDYYSSDALWLKSNLSALDTFPECWFFPGFWSEYGMCTEPSAFGAKMCWDDKMLPHAESLSLDISELAEIAIPDVTSDGMLPFMINRLKLNQGRIRDIGHDIRFAVSRGPLNVASFLCGTQELLTLMMEEPEKTFSFISKVNQFIVEWLKYQKECFPSIEGIMILDDIVGFLGEDQFKTMALPCLKEEFAAFDAPVRLFHNDARGLVCSPYLKEIGVNIFNHSYEHSINDIRKLCGPHIVLMGNIPPRDVLAGGTIKDVRMATIKEWEKTKDRSRVIWSCGGGVPPDVPTANIRRFIKTVYELHGKQIGM